MKNSPKGPNPIDVHVGSRVKLRRVMLGLSQEKLGDQIGITYQQVQKYEKGTNRISASRMQEIADVLDTPISYFFESMPSSGLEKIAGLSEIDSPEYIEDFLATSDGLKLNRAFVKIKDPKLREKVIELVISMADTQDTKD